jgi:methionine aminopeptidase
MPETERRINQLEADIHEIYGILRDMRDSLRSAGASVLRQGSRLNQIESDLQGIAEVQTEHSRTLVGHGQKLDRIIELLTITNPEM